MVTVFALHVMGAIPNAGPYIEFSIEPTPWADGLLTEPLEAERALNMCVAMSKPFAKDGNISGLAFSRKFGANSIEHKWCQLFRIICQLLGLHGLPVH